MLRSVVVNLMDWDGGVDDMWLDCLLLNDWLDGLVDMVVDVLASDGWCNGLSCSTLNADGLVLELSSLLFETGSYVTVVAVVVFTVLDWCKVVGVLLWQDLAVLDRLDGCVVVILVDLFVNGGLDVLVSCSSNGLVLDSWGNTLVNGGVVVTGLGHEAADCLLCFVHVD